MIPVLPPAALGQEAAACVVLGAGFGAARAFWPVKGRAAFVPDLLLVGGVLAALQSYAAGQSAAGVLRWYMVLAGFVGAGAAAFVLGVPLRAAGRFAAQCAGAPVRYLRHLAGQRALRRRAEHQQAHKLRRSAKRTAEKHKKNLPNQRRMMYNSNVSK